MSEQAVQPDPWPVAQEAVFNMVRAWVDPQYKDAMVIAERCLEIMQDVNKTEGAPYIFVCELARVLAVLIARDLEHADGSLPSREEVMEEISLLELDYIEESVLADLEPDDEEDDN